MTRRGPLRSVDSLASALRLRALGSIARVVTDEPYVALTFDDGPDPEATPKVLEILATHGASATFFMLGCEAAKHPRLVAEVARRGHAIGNHGWDHTSLPTLSRRGRLRQLRATAQALEPYAGRLFRPPYGHQTAATRLEAWIFQLDVVVWSLSAEDWRGQPADWIVDRVTEKIAPGQILLFHDRLETPARPEYTDRRPTLEALDRLLAEQSGRFRFVTLPRLLQSGRPVRKLWFYQAPPRPAVGGA